VLEVNSLAAELFRCVRGGVQCQLALRLLWRSISGDVFDSVKLPFFGSLAEACFIVDGNLLDRQKILRGIDIRTPCCRECQPCRLFEELESQSRFCCRLQSGIVHQEGGFK